MYIENTITSGNEETKIFERGNKERFHDIHNHKNYIANTLTISST